MSHLIYKTITDAEAGLEAHIYYDTDPHPPENDIVHIAYSSNCYCLGTQSCTREQLDKIRDSIASGKYVGVPVWAYVHSGATISTGKKLRGDTTARLRENPYGCPWDSGQSGFAYMTYEDALRGWGRKRLSAKQKAKAIAYIDAAVDEFAAYLRGECYGIRIMRGEEMLDTGWGFIGNECAEEEARALLAHYKTAEV